MDAVAYIRVSTNKEEQELSLENQREFLKNTLAIVTTRSFAYTVTKANQPPKMKTEKIYKGFLSAARRGEFQRLYVKDISRLFRNT